MLCTSHLHMQCKFGHRNWQIPIAEIGLYHRREWIFYLSYHWYFCRLKWLLFKNFCATQSVLLSPAGAWSEQLHTGRLLRFCQYNLNLLWGLQDWSAVPQVQPYGSWRLQAVQSSYLQFMELQKNQDFVLSGIHFQSKSNQKKSQFLTFHSSSCAQNKEDFSWGEPECFLFLSLHQLILVLQLYFSIHFNDNFSLAVGNLQHAELVTLYFMTKPENTGEGSELHGKRYAYSLPFFRKLEYRIDLSLHFLLNMRFLPLRKLSSVVTKLFFIQFWNSECYFENAEGQILRFAWALQCSDILSYWIMYTFSW